MMRRLYQEMVLGKKEQEQLVQIQSALESSAAHQGRRASHASPFLFL